MGKATKVAKISKIDIKKLQQHMTDVIDKTQKELKEIKDYKSEIARLKLEVTSMKKGKLLPQVKVDHVALDRAKNEGYKIAGQQYSTQVNEVRRDNKILFHKLEQIAKILDKQIPKFIETKTKTERPKIEIPKPITQVTHKSNQPVTKQSLISDGEHNLNLCERKLYSLLFQYAERSFSKSQIGVFTGYSHRSGGFNNALSHLRQMGLIEGSGSNLKAKELNSDIAQEFDFSKEAIISKLNKCEKEIYSVLLENPHETFSKEELASATPTQYSSNSGGFNNAISRLNTLGLIQRTDGMIKLNPELLEIE